MWPNPQFPADLVTFTEKILNQKLFFRTGEVNESIPQKYLFWERLFPNIKLNGFDIYGQNALFLTDLSLAPK